MIPELFFYPTSAPARACDLTFRMAGIDHKLTTLDLYKGETRTPQFLAINPAHCVPTLKDDDLVIWESRAIMQYVLNKYSPASSLYPFECKHRAKVDMLLNWDQGTLYPAVVDAYFTRLGWRPMPDDIEAKIETFEAKMKLLNDHLLAGPFLTGDEITIADISIAATLTMPTLLNEDGKYKRFERIAAWLGRIHQLPEWCEVDDMFQAGRLKVKK